MKVIEKGTDRRAQVNVYVEGQVQALEEYGEYIDPRDNAICCYVAIDEGHKPRVGGRFTGTTLAVAYDTVVDGVLRKAHSYVAKAVSIQHNRKIDTEKVLCKTAKGIIDTEITAAPLVDVITTQGDGPETIGTIEHRLYITRQLGDSHDASNIKKYYNMGANIEDNQADDTEQKVSYKLIPQTLRMSLDKTVAPLEERQPSLHQRRADARRPGSEPWAVFRFHYRSQEDISEQNMVMTYDPESRDTTDPHTLALDPVPILQVGAKPLLKNDGDVSSRSSSPMPPSTGSTPAKSAHTAPKISNPTKKKLARSKSPKATVMASPTGQVQTSTSKMSPAASPEKTTNPETQNKILAPSKPSTAEVTKAFANGETDNGTSAVNNSGGEKVVGKITGPPFDSAVDSTTKVASVPDLNTKPANVHPETPAVVAKETITKPPQSPITPAKKPAAKPTPISAASTNARKKPDTPPVAAAPAKRSSATTNGATPEPKRTKVAPTPPLPSTQPTVPQIPARSSTPKTISIERQLADQRKKLEDVRKRRLETARKQAEIDEQMGPYKQRMAEELDRLNREMMEEEIAYTEEAEHYSASVEILQDCKKEDGGE